MNTPTDVRPVKRTPVTITEFRDAVRTGFESVFGVTPSDAVIGIVWSQWALETGRGKSCFNYNVGNIKQFDHTKPLHMLNRVWEIVDGKRVEFSPPHPQTWFRAYDSLGDGVVDYLSVLKRRFSRATPALLSGEPATFAEVLGACGYYTASASEYRAAMRSLHAEFMRAV